jgi:hypothetical protein
MVTNLSGGHNVLHEDSVSIRPPAELPEPFLYGFVDGAYSDAVFAVLAAGDDLSRRLGRAIDWLDLAWRNTPSITPEVRVVLIRTGFEVLFGTDNTYAVRDELSTLLDGEDAEREERRWNNRAGNIPVQAPAAQAAQDHPVDRLQGRLGRGRSPCEARHPEALRTRSARSVTRLARTAPGHRPAGVPAETRAGPVDR